MKFTKMHGCGNDYIYFNCFENNIDNPEELSIKLSDRHFGVGGDGIVMICPSEIADAKMRMFNADGSEGKMCGNAIRCVGKFLYDNGIAKNEKMNIETLSGIKILELTIENGVCEYVKVDMGKAALKAADIPVIADSETVVDMPLAVDGRNYNITCVSMGNPHCVIFSDDVQGLDLEKIGRKFENHNIFPERVNTEFVKVIDKNNIEMRVWERGSGETFACGTGACASVVACVLNGKCKIDEEVAVKLIGGVLKITYKSDGSVIMKGPATKVFEGEVVI